MKTLVKFLYLVVFVFFAISSKPFRLVGIYQQERFLQVAKEVGVKISSERATWLTGKINNKIKELKTFMDSQETFDCPNDKATLLTDEVNELVGSLVAENTKSVLYRFFVWFT